MGFVPGALLVPRGGWVTIRLRKRTFNDGTLQIAKTGIDERIAFERGPVIVLYVSDATAFQKELELGLFNGKDVGWMMLETAKTYFVSD